MHLAVDRAMAEDHPISVGVITRAVTADLAVDQIYLYFDIRFGVQYDVFLPQQMNASAEQRKMILVGGRRYSTRASTEPTDTGDVECMQQQSEDFVLMGRRE